MGDTPCSRLGGSLSCSPAPSPLFDPSLLIPSSSGRALRRAMTCCLRIQSPAGPHEGAEEGAVCWILRKVMGARVKKPSVGTGDSIKSISRDVGIPTIIEGNGNNGMVSCTPVGVVGKKKGFLDLRPGQLQRNILLMTSISPWNFSTLICCVLIRCLREVRKIINRSFCFMFRSARGRKGLKWSKQLGEGKIASFAQKNNKNNALRQKLRCIFTCACEKCTHAKRIHVRYMERVFQGSISGQTRSAAFLGHFERAAEQPPPHPPSVAGLRKACRDSLPLHARTHFHYRQIAACSVSHAFKKWCARA